MTVRISGLAEMRRFIANLPATLEKNVLRGAMRAGAQVIADDAIDRLQSHKESGDLARSVKVRVAATDRKVEASVDVDDFKAHWLEHGTEPHFILARPERGSVRMANRQLKRGALLLNGAKIVAEVHHPGARAFPFLLPAADAKEGEAVAAAQAHLDRHAAAALQGRMSPGSEPDQP